MKIDYSQSFYLAAGKNACYALCIIDIARDWYREEAKADLGMDDVSALLIGINSGCIDFREDDYLWNGNFYVANPSRFLSLLTGLNWIVTKEKADYKCAPGEQEVQFWALDQKKADLGEGHFIRPGKNTLQQSLTVEKGQCYSKRIFKKYLNII